MKNSTLALGALCLLASGCGTLGSRPTAAWPFEPDKLCPTGTCTNVDAIRVNSEASKLCRNVYNFYENGNGRANALDFALHTVGALSGSVFAKTAKGSGSVAWAGLSGVTNTLEPSLEKAFSSALESKRQKAVFDAIKQGNTNYWAGHTADERVAISIQMAAACATAAASADDAALKAMARAELAEPANRAPESKSNEEAGGKAPDDPGAVKKTDK